VKEVQRARLLAAALEVIEEHGHAGLSVSRVVERAKVSRKTFYDAFGSRDGCLEAVRAAAAIERPGAGRSKAPIVVGRGIRLTHRRLLVLAAISENPGACNREVGDAAGMVGMDAGQVAGVLRRMAGCGLVVNLGRGAGGRRPNAWGLTGVGAEVARVIRK
jgi:AcrR family transcriptional regulator